MTTTHLTGTALSDQTGDVMADAISTELDSAGLWIDVEGPEVAVCYNSDGVRLVTIMPADARSWMAMRGAHQRRYATYAEAADAALRGVFGW